MPIMINHFLQEILAKVVVEMAIFGSASLGDIVKRLFHKEAGEAPAGEIRELLQGLGELSQRQIHHLVHGWADRHPDVLGEAELQELENIFWAVSRGAHFINSQGRPSSMYVRSERLLEQLLSDIQPVRRRGDTVGDWKLETFLGQGSFGEVWTARYDRHADRFQREPHVFKFFVRPQSQEWIEREEVNLLKLEQALPQDHPNIVKLYNISIANQQYPFFEFEYCAGGSLEQWITADPDERVCLDKWKVINGIAEGLATAHRAGIFHRDMKPANVVLTDGEDPIPKLTDFGLATAMPESSAAAAHRSAGYLVGTPMYFPPEVQQPFAEVDPAQHDVFALGVIWYQLCVEKLERPPYNFAERLARHDIDSRTIELISDCLADPSERFRDAHEFQSHLTDRVPPNWQVPEGLYDVQHLLREYIAEAEPR